MTEHLRYYGNTYCCPACGTAFTLIRPEITGCSSTAEDRTVLHCPACPADTAVRVSDEELHLLTSYITIRRDARALICARTSPRTTTGDRT